MATIQANIKEKVFPIRQFLGLNQAPNGDANLKYGEAAAMQNFKITDDYSLQIRPGTKTIAGLLSNYSLSVATATTIVKTELNTSTATFTVSPAANISTTGIISLSGISGTVTQSNYSSYSGYFWKDSTTGLTYKLGTCTYSVASGEHVSGGSISVSNTEVFIGYGYSACDFYSDVKVLSSAVYTTGTKTTTSYPTAGMYYSYGGNVYRISRYEEGTNWVLFYGYLVSFSANDSYAWNFYLVSAVNGTTDKVVRGIWSGKVGSSEYLVAACNGTLWSLTSSSGVWSKANIGSVATTNGHIHMFGFDGKLYILDGTEYHVWDGTTLANVTGYRPLVVTASPPAGGGTTLESINKLNGLRRVRFSPTGGNTYQLPEKSLTSVDYAKMVSDNSSVSYSVNLATGIVTTTSTLAAGTNTFEIGYSVSTNYRTQITTMRYSETFNGATDARIFLYGDGSNKAYYSGLDSDGSPRADYFPDLNVITFDSSNIPITAMIKHFDKLLTFKTNSVYETSYGAITLADGTTTAGFYTVPLHRSIGNEALGQVCLVKNDPYSLFEGGIYDWRMSSFYAKDERIAKKISQRVVSTVSAMDLQDAVCFNDIINGEYWLCQGGNSLVYNANIDAWYLYTGFTPKCFTNIDGDLYFGDENGNLVRLSRDYLNDNGTNVVSYWESGSMSFGAEYLRKYSPCLWVAVKPEANGLIKVTVQTDKQTDYTDKSVLSNYTEGVASGFFDFFNLDFTKLSFNVNDKPQIQKLKLKVKKFAYYKLIFSSDSNNTTATITSADMRVRYTSDVR